MNFSNKSSMVLAGATVAGLLAACSGRNDAVGSTSEVVGSSQGVVIAKVYATAPRTGGTPGALAGDYVQLFNPTNAPVLRNVLSLQLATNKGVYLPKYAVSLKDPADSTAVIAPHHYFLVSLTPGADLGVTPDLQAAPVLLTDGGTPTPLDLDPAGGSVAVVREDLLDCDTLQNCTNAPGVQSVFGYGAIDGDPPFSEKKPFAALTATSAAARKGGGCAITGSSAEDFEPSATKPFDTDGPVCSSSVDGGTDAAADAGGDAATDASDASSLPPPKDGGGKDAATDDDGSDDGSDEDAGGTAPTLGKKKTTNANAASQPIASSDSSCAASPGPTPTSAFAGLAGLAIALASLGRRKKK